MRNRFGDRARKGRDAAARLEREAAHAREQHAADLQSTQEAATRQAVYQLIAEAAAALRVANVPPTFRDYVSRSREDSSEAREDEPGFDLWSARCDLASFHIRTLAMSTLGVPVTHSDSLSYSWRRSSRGVCWPADYPYLGTIGRIPVTKGDRPKGSSWISPGIAVGQDAEPVFAYWAESRHPDFNGSWAWKPVELVLEKFVDVVSSQSRRS